MSKTLLGLMLPIFTEETEKIFDNNEVFRNEDLESTLFYEENQLFTSLIIGIFNKFISSAATIHLIQFHDKKIINVVVLTYLFLFST